MLTFPAPIVNYPGKRGRVAVLPFRLFFRSPGDIIGPIRQRKGGGAVKWFLQRKPVRFALDVATVFLDRRGSRSAAELAYFLVLSLFPLLIMVNAVVGMLHLDVEEIIRTLSDFMPAQAAGVVADYVAYISGNQSRGLFWAGLVMTLTSSSAAFRALMNVTADIYRKPAYPGFWTVVASVVFSAAFLVIMYLSIVVC